VIIGMFSWWACKDSYGGQKYYRFRITVILDSVRSLGGRYKSGIIVLVPFNQSSFVALLEGRESAGARSSAGNE
jgi:hypothetical protein